MDFWWILYIFDFGLFLPVVLTCLYILVFSFFSLVRISTKAENAKQANRFIVLIPSLGANKTTLETVNSILGQTYPQRNFDVVVVSDHQDELMNMRLAQLPITLLTPNFERSSKVKSLQYAILNLPQFKIYDAVVLLNTGDIVEPEFLEQVNNAYVSAGTKVIQTHRMARKITPAVAHLDAVFQEINNAIFRHGHLVVGLSAALNSSGCVFDFQWFKQNIMKIRAAVGEEKALESMLLREGIYIDYFEDINVYNTQVDSIDQFNDQRRRWTFIQIHSLVNNIRYLPYAIVSHRYDLADKIIQWMLVPRTIMMGLIMIMSIILPFIYLTLAIKWWVVAAVVLFAYSLATPDYLVDKNWDRVFLRAPFITVGALVNIFRAGKDEADYRINAVSRLLRKLKIWKK